MSDLETGTLTPRSADIVEEIRFSGGFGQPDGFASVLIASVRTDGSLCLRLDYRGIDHIQVWAVELTNEQREAIAGLTNRYRPRVYEWTVQNGKPVFTPPA
jgi:hypothetical protein